MAVAAKQNWPTALSTAARLASFAIICGLLFWGQVVLIPLALAALVTFLISPLVTRLDRWGLPRIVAVIIVASGVTGLIGALGYVVAGELGELAEELPEYRENIRSKIGDLRSMTRGGTIESVQKTIEDISEDVQRDAAAQAPTAAEDDRGEPVTVAVEPEQQSFGDAEYLSPVFQAAATAGLTMLLSIFMLIKREDLRNRLVSLAGEASLAVTTKAFAEAGQRISRYLLMQFIINASMGVAVGLGLYLIGVPYSALWGLAAGVLRYIPYVGPWLAALLPITVSLITAPGWEQVVLVVSLFLVLELFSNNVMEPWLYGQSVGLSPIAVIVAAIFWTWLWGPLGLVISTPMTACLVVLSRYVPELAAFDRLLSERPALQPHLWLYQRLLARDEDEAEDIVEEHREDHPLSETCDELLLGSLLALKRDLAAGRVIAEDGEYVESALREMIDEMVEDLDSESAGRVDAEDEPERPATEPVLLIGMPVRDTLDDIALQLLGVLLRETDCTLQILSPEALIGERIAEVEARKPAAVCIASLPGDLMATRHVCKRLRARLPAVPLIVGRLLNSRSAPERSRQLLKAAGAQHVVSTLDEFRDLLQQVVRNARPGATAEEGLNSGIAAADRKLA
ncbi:MAG TPA: AI-2E family transporter [Woeseiaceae bacterium]|nr:AI-2E family transporter [Woeseiaceae bacterium]